MTAYNLLNGDLKKIFFKYLTNGIGGMLITSIYILADTIMIGKGVGAVGISALNIILPLFNVFYAFGLLFGVGAGVLISVSRGRDDEKAAEEYFALSLFLSIVTSALMILFMRLFLVDIAYFLGANEHNISYVLDYAGIISKFGFVYLFGDYFQFIVRNDNDPLLSTIAVITGGVLNVILDYIFIFILDMGMYGASLATCISSGMGVFIMLLHFKIRKNIIHFHFKNINFKKASIIIKNGLSSFVVEFCLSLVIFLFNLQALRYIGESGVVVYGILVNAMYFGTALYNGVSRGAQPVIATNFGANKTDRVKEVFKMGMKTTIFIGVILFIIQFFFPMFLINIFVNANDEILNIGVTAVKIYSFVLLFQNMNVYFEGYFQSVVEPKRSLFLSLSRCFVLTVLFLYLLPCIIGVNGLWMSVPLSEFITFVFALYIYYH